MTDGQLWYHNSWGEKSSIDILRIQIEQDSAKSVHDLNTLVDYNRAGAPLLEIVTAPVLGLTPSDASLLVWELQDTLRVTKVSNANMEAGEMWCDINISCESKEIINGSIQTGERVEIKNVMGLKVIEKAIEAEINR